MSDGRDSRVYTYLVSRNRERLHELFCRACLICCSYQKNLLNAAPAILVAIYVQPLFERSRHSMLTMCCASEGVIGRKALGSSSSSPSSKDCFRAVYNVAVQQPCAPSAALKCALQVSTFEGGSSPTLLVPQASNHLNEHSLNTLKFIEDVPLHRPLGLLQ